MKHVIFATLATVVIAACTVVDAPTGFPGSWGTIGDPGSNGGAGKPNTPCPAYVNPQQCPPFPTGGPYSIGGTVIQWTNGKAAPLAGARVWGFVTMTNGNGYAMAPAVSDSAGHYTMQLVPNGTVVLVAGNQPCVSAVTVANANTTMDIEVLTSGTRPVSPTDSPTLSGIVYENSPTGRRPVAGALVMFEYLMDFVSATTTTDAQGHYSLCRMPIGGQRDLFVVADGKTLADVVVTVSGDQVLDIEVKP